MTESNGVNAKDVAFDGRGNRTRIHRVITHVGAAVNAGNHKVRPIVQKTGQRQMYAIRWSPAYDENIFGSVGHGKRLIERERIARAAVVVFGRNDGNATKSAHFVGQRIDTRRHVAVVIADEDMHSSKRPSWASF